MGARRFKPDMPAISLEVSAVQAKTALYNAGLYDQVEAVLGGSEYAMVRIWWSSAQSWRRDHPYIAGMAVELDLTDEDVDALFEAAAGVPT
ncbi:hypothetical protein SAMN06297251_12718 [Fulvimarina manganoxydans]|uniref:Uncharacterized protein n=1 Tax=Fulvimarina manganoxydans TaxID=937218 RepID=A0A1W2EJT7_9HYPH|nr:hypothetical protein [Fulvimarina manganoxydans]SMD09980.1 hypothetical protein SAMN06297251_12718 [Fulvimarina manganoxydans]